MVDKCKGLLEVLEGKYGLNSRKTLRELTICNSSLKNYMLLECG